MASIARDKNGNRRILFVAPEGSRKTVRLGKVSHRTAEGIKLRVEALLASKLTGHPLDGDTADWVGNLGPTLAKRLAAVGLIVDQQAKPVATLGAFLAEYIASRTDVKPSTTRHLNESRKRLVSFFGMDKALAEICPGDADDFRRHLLKSLGDNSVRRTCGRAKQFFRFAVRKRLIRENPFGDMRDCGVQANRTRDYFITRAEAQQVLDACPDAQWRLLFALSRYGGLRCPSEHLALTWGDVDWERGRLTVHSPKTEHHEGKGSRVVPIFPELRPHLEAVWEQAEPGTKSVITRYRDGNANLRTQLERIIRRAGLATWPKLFHNLRASRQTELAQTFPIHVVCEWIGNSQAVAMKHYLRVTDADYDRALASAETGDKKAAQNPAQQALAGSGLEAQRPRLTNEKAPVFPGLATTDDDLPMHKVPPDGLEPSTL